jgi:hypothetical protein
MAQTSTELKAVNDVLELLGPVTGIHDWFIE